jgi:hypothetical protein
LAGAIEVGAFLRPFLRPLPGRGKKDILARAMAGT